MKDSALPNPFAILPTAQEKDSRERRNWLEKANSFPQEVVFEISHKFFISSIANALSKPTTCIMQLQSCLMNSPHSIYLSDFVAICTIFVYKNIQKSSKGELSSQTQSQAVAFWANVIDGKYLNFTFEPDEQDLIISSIVADPPIYKKDYDTCVSIVSFFCKSEDRFCFGRFIERLKLAELPDGSKRFLVDCCKEIIDSNPLISTNEREFLKSFIKQKPAEEEILKTKEIEPTPTKQRLDELIKENRIEKLYNWFRPYKLLYFILFTIIILVIAVLI